MERSSLPYFVKTTKLMRIYSYGLLMYIYSIIIAAIATRGDGLFVASVFRLLPRQFKLQNGERAKS